VVSDRAAIAAVARHELARRRLVDYAGLMLPSYERAAHLDLLCSHLEALERRDIHRLIVAMPPRHGKSLHVSQLLPSWWLGRRASESVLLASYAAELAEQNSRRTRALVRDPSYPFLDVRVSDESAAVNRWHTTDGGGVLAVGVRGGATGHGAHLLCVDDPVKDAEEAASPTVLAATWEWWTQVALTRLMPNAAVLLTMTRWSEGDLVGRVLDSPGADDWTVLSLPAIAEEDDALGRGEGEALWPDRYDGDVLEQRRIDLGSRAFSALYQQAPTSAEGNTFKREWLAGRYERLPEKLEVVTAVDSSFGEGAASDYSAIVTVGSDRSHHYILDVRRGRWEFPKLLQEIERVAADWKPRALLIEDTGSGKSALQALRDSTRIEVVGVKTGGRSKVSRAEAVSPSFEAGKVLFPSQPFGWRDPLVEELADFPGGKHDDQVDALVYALERLRAAPRSKVGEVSRVEHRARKVGDALEADWTDPRVGEAVRRDEDFEEWERRVKRETPPGRCWSCGVAYGEEGARIGSGGRICDLCLKPSRRREQYALAQAA
jgi:predicted phage terminase large subunit-like protein